MNPFRFIKSGGLELAVYSWGEAAPGRSTVLLVHGYPDAAGVWRRIAAVLAQNHHVIAYDVRGAGRSQAPARRREYSLKHLADDLAHVIDVISPDAPVHLVAHDWGSIQSWEAVTRSHMCSRIASFTSISGPCLDHVGWWLRRRLGEASSLGLTPVLRQLANSWYIAMFQLPAVAPAAWKLGLARRWPALLNRFEGIRTDASPTQVRDGVNGVNLYRANILPRLLRPRERHTQVPVQVIVPTRDRFMRRDLLDDLPQWTPKLWQRDIDAGHWVLLSHPEALAAMVAEFIDRIGRGQPLPPLQADRCSTVPEPETAAS